MGPPRGLILTLGLSHLEPFRLAYTHVEKPVENLVEKRLSQCKHKHFDVLLLILCFRSK